MKRAPNRLAATLTIVNVAAVAVCSTAFAQITVTNATFPTAGDTLKMAIDVSPAAGVVTITPPGGDQFWDFSGLQVDTTINTVFRPAGEGSVQIPGADLFAVTSPILEDYYSNASDREEYFNATNDRIESQAFYGTPYDIVVNSTFYYYPPLGERRAPVNFFDINQASSGVLAKFPPGAFSPSLIAALPFSADSLRYRIAINRLDVVDAWGSLSIPGGTYDVLRQKSTRYREIRLDAKIPPLGWLDVTGSAVLAGFQGLNIDTTVTYLFINNVEKEPIAVLNAGSQGAIVKQVTFKYNRSMSTSVADAENSIPGSYVLHANYPNPFNPTTTLVYDMSAQGDVLIEIYSVLGKKLRTLVNAMQPAGRHTLVWDARDDSGNQVTSGIYFARMYAGGGGKPVVMTQKMMLIK